MDNMNSLNGVNILMVRTVDVVFMVVRELGGSVLYAHTENTHTSTHACTQTQKRGLEMSVSMLSHYFCLLKFHECRGAI